MKRKEKIEKIDEIENISNIENLAEIEKENVESIAKELEHVKCPHCGYMNFELTKKCTKCHYDLDFVNKSCPNCGKINGNAVKRCECGFNFNRQKRSLLINLIITIIVMVLVFVLTKYYGNILEKYDMALKVFSIYIIFVCACRIFISSHPKDGFGAEHEMLERYKVKSNPRVTCNILIILGFIAAVVFLVYYYYFR